jgi:transketolase
MAGLEDLTVHTIKGLAMDAVQAAQSGHPGMPMGMADLAVVLWGEFLKHDPSKPDWPDRDRVVLSNGHGSMLLYSMLYLTGTSLTIDDLKRFRQWGSPTAGHPELGEAPGIETTTGPLGQGLANAVGMAIAERWLRERFGSELVDHGTWALCGDGCLMEGISSEATSLAGHLGLDRLTILYDDNGITIDGRTSLSFSEDVPKRFEAIGWHTQVIDGHDRTAIRKALEAAKAETSRPSIICARTVIAHGAPNLAGTNKAHGAPLGDAEVRATKERLGLDPDVTFAVPDDVLSYVRRDNPARRDARLAWEARLAKSEQRARFERFHGDPNSSEVSWPTFETGSKLATRKAGEKVIQALSQRIENLIGGSADLAESNGSYMHGGGDVARGAWDKRNLHFGIREHAMASISNGLSLHGGVVPYCATFLTFHDYMRPAVRLAAIMHRPVVYVYTHDSVWLGEDGPTHQPIEHLMAMRAMPNLWVVRPADANETVAAWKLALARRDGPTALCLTRQNLPVLANTGPGLERGAYVLADEPEIHVVLIATGSEVALALQAKDVLGQEGIRARVVSMPCTALFDRQDAAYRSSVLPTGVPRVSIEAGTTFGWERWVDGGISIGIDRFGASAPGAVVADKLGLNVPNVVAKTRELLGAR